MLIIAAKVNGLISLERIKGIINRPFILAHKKYSALVSGIDGVLQEMTAVENKSA